MAETDQFPDQATLRQWAQEAAENLPSIMTLAEKWIDTSTFLDEDALPEEEEAGA